MDKIEEALVLATSIVGDLSDMAALPFDEARVKLIRDESAEPDAELLEDLLKLPDVGGNLSLANPYPVTVCGLVRESYAVAVAELAVCFDPRSQTLPEDLLMQCLKEYERATGRGCNVVYEARRQVETANQARDDWMAEQRAAGKTLKEIRVGIRSQNESWTEITTDQGVLAALVRHETRKRADQR